MGELGFFRGERVELVKGVVVQMSPIGPAHASILRRLEELLIVRLQGRATVSMQLPFLAADDSEPQPDIAVVPLGRYADRHPASALLIVEVAVSSLAYDRETKAPLYAASGVEEYWIVDVLGRAIEVYTAPENGLYTCMRRVVSGHVLPAAFPDVAVDVTDLVGGGS